MAVASSLSPERLADPLWRLSNLYHVVDEEGHDFKFVPNEEQLDFFQHLWYRNNVLKARQLGITTFCSLFALDQAMWNHNYTASLVAHTREDAGKIFRNKIQYAYEHLPASLRERIPLKQKNAGKELLFTNGSSVSVSTSARGGTLQFLHVSEFAKICRRFPEKATEIVTGSFEALPASSIIVVESTAEGNAGPYFDQTMEALKLAERGGPLAKLQWRLHFYPWFLKAAYRSDDGFDEITAEDERYFDKLERLLNVKIDRRQRAWYVLKRKTLKQHMQREYPSTPQEAFSATVDGSIYVEEMSILRRLGRIGSVPFTPGYKVNTFWDLGASAGNATAIWLHQRVGATDRFIGFMQDTGKGIRHFWTKLRELQKLHEGWQWGKHYMPHDGKARLQGAELQTRVEILEMLQQETADLEKGFVPGEVVGIERTQDLGMAIELTKRKMTAVYIDDQACAEGIKAMDNYQYEWDEGRAIYSRTPLHNWCSNPCDAFRQWAQGYEPEGPHGLRRQGEDEGNESRYVRGGY